MLKMSLNLLFQEEILSLEVILNKEIISIMWNLEDLTNEGLKRNFNVLKRGML